MAKVFSSREAILRIYDATATPLYVVASFLGDLSVPIGRMRPEEVLQLNMGKADSKAHYTVQTDAAALQPVQLTFGGKLHTTDFVDDLLIALSNPWDAATWKPGGSSTFVGVTTLGSYINAEGSSLTFPMPFDAQRAAHLVNVEVLWDDASTDWGLKMQGVYFEPGGITIDKGDEGESTFSCTGTVYGAITTIATFTSGAEIS